MIGQICQGLAQFTLAGHSGHPVHGATIAIDDQDCRSTADVECPNCVQMIRDIELDVGDPLMISQHPLDQGSGLRADRAELARELDDGDLVDGQRDPDVCQKRFGTRCADSLSRRPVIGLCRGGCAAHPTVKAHAKDCDGSHDQQHSSKSDRTLNTDAVHACRKHLTARGIPALGASVCTLTEATPPITNGTHKASDHGFVVGELA